MAMNTIRPSTYSDSGYSSRYHINETNVWDANTGTYAELGDGNVTNNQLTTFTYFGFPDVPILPPPTASLYVHLWDWTLGGNWSTGSRELHMEYSINGGSSWTDVIDFETAGAGHVHICGPIDVSAAGATTSNIRVRIRMLGGKIKIYISEIYVDITYTASLFRAAVIGL